MVRKIREKPKPADIETFISGADPKDESVIHDTPKRGRKRTEPRNPLTDDRPNAPRKYTTLTIPFNKHEFEQLELASEKTGEAKFALIREGLQLIYEKYGIK